MTTYWSTRFQSYPSGPHFCQRSVETWDGAPDENNENNCGMNVINAHNVYTAGVWIAPDSIKGAIIDPKFPGKLDSGLKGVTSESDLRTFLSHYCSTPTTHLNPTTTQGNAAGSLLNLIWDYTNRGYGLVCLRWWGYKDSGYHHWVEIIGLDDTFVFFYDPWTGEITTETYDEFRGMYQGILFSLDRKRDPLL